MARLTRQVGITSAQVRLPEPVSVGPAIVKTALTMADREFVKQSDIRTQEAQIAAAKLNFERDAEGNLVAPSLPFGDNGLLAPSIYDRTYTQMVGQRYLQQTQIDTSKRINELAVEHRFDPKAFQTVAEGYVRKVTELAPDYLKPQVNNAAQVKMVEHYNHIIREKAERDHSEARGVHLETMQNLSDELIGYIEAHADDEIVGAKMLEIRAAIEQGDELNYWLDDEKIALHDALNKRMSLAEIITQINDVPLGDDVATAEMIQSLSEFATGDGKIVIVDEFGQRKKVDAASIYPNPDDRAQIADHAAKVLTAKQANFENLLDARLDRDWKNFFNWFTKHSIEVGETGQLDMDRLYREFDKAHNDVMTKGYDDTLREAIADIILGSLNRGSGSLSQEEQYFLEDFMAFQEMLKAESEKRLAGGSIEDMSPEEALAFRHKLFRDVGGLSSGNFQTAGNSRFISKYYSGLSGRDLQGMNGRRYWNDILQNPTDEKWQEVEWMAKYVFAPYGIWPRELSDAIIGKVNDPEGMNQKTLEDVLRLTRAFWDNETFRHNMTDQNALGTKVGRALDALFRLGGQPTPEELQKKLQDYSNPNYTPQTIWRDREDKEKFTAAADAALDRHFKANWRTGYIPSGMQTSTFGFNPFDRDLVGYPTAVKEAVMNHIIENAGFIDPDDPDTFMPFINRSVKNAMHENGYAPSQIGYNPARFGENYNFEFTRPDSAIVHRPPEYYAQDAEGNIDRLLMDLIEDDFQHLLDEYGKERGEKWKAGVNAALRFNSKASSDNGYPVWDVMLIREGGLEPDILTVDGLYDGDNVPFTIQDALRRHPIINKEKLRTRALLNQQQRLDKQTGRYMLRYHPFGDMSMGVPDPFAIEQIEKE